MTIPAEPTTKLDLIHRRLWQGELLKLSGFTVLALRHKGVVVINSERFSNHKGETAFPFSYYDQKGTATVIAVVEMLEQIKQTREPIYTCQKCSHDYIRKHSAAHRSGQFCSLDCEERQDKLSPPRITDEIPLTPCLSELVTHESTGIIQCRACWVMIPRDSDKFFTVAGDPCCSLECRDNLTRRTITVAQLDAEGATLIKKSATSDVAPEEALKDESDVLESLKKYAAQGAATWEEFRRGARETRQALGVVPVDHEELRRAEKRAALIRITNEFQDSIMSPLTLDEVLQEGTEFEVTADGLGNIKRASYVEALDWVAQHWVKYGTRFHVDALRDGKRTRVASFPRKGAALLS